MGLGSIVSVRQFIVHKPSGFRKVKLVMNDRPIEEKRALVLAQLRGYKVLDRHEEDETITFLVELPEGKKAIILCMLNRKVGIAIIRKLEESRDKEVIKRIIISNLGYTSDSREEAKKQSVELIPTHFPCFNIFEHKLVPKHEIPPEKKLS